MRTDQELEQLALRVGRVLDGEHFFDAASVTALCCAWAICGGSPTPEERRATLAQIVKFMEEQIERMPGPR